MPEDTQTCYHQPHGHLGMNLSINSRETTTQLWEWVAFLENYKTDKCARRQGRLMSCQAEMPTAMSWRAFKNKTVSHKNCTHIDGVIFKIKICKQNFTSELQRVCLPLETAEVTENRLTMVKSCSVVLSLFFLHLTADSLIFQHKHLLPVSTLALFHHICLTTQTT